MYRTCIYIFTCRQSHIHWCCSCFDVLCPLVVVYRNWIDIWHCVLRLVNCYVVQAKRGTLLKQKSESRNWNVRFSLKFIRMRVANILTVSFLSLNLCLRVCTWLTCPPFRFTWQCFIAMIIVLRDFFFWNKKSFHQVWRLVRTCAFSTRK